MKAAILPNFGRRRGLTLFIIILFISSAWGAKKPAWISNPPVDPAYYTGVGSAQIHDGSSDHIQAAQQAALANIAAQIQVKIDASVMSSIAESGDDIEENFKRNIKSSTQAQLEGYELVGQYTENAVFYAYYRLSREKWARIQAEKRRKAAELSISFYHDGQKALNDGQPAVALSNLIRALESIDAYIPEGLNAELDGEKVFLANRIYQAVQQILDNLSLSPIQKVVEAKTGQALKNTGFSAEWNGSPVKNLLLSIQGNGDGNDLPATVTTDMGGRAMLRAAVIHDSRKIQNIRADVDLSGKNAAQSLFYPALLAGLTRPSAVIMLRISGPVIYLSSEETLDGNPLSMKRVEPLLKSSLTDAGFSFSEDMASADFIMELHAAAHQGSQVSSLFTSFADMNLSVMGMDGNELYKNSLKHIKGIDLSFEKAGMKALDAIAEKFRSDMAPDLITALH